MGRSRSVPGSVHWAPLCHHVGIDCFTQSCFVVFYTHGSEIFSRELLSSSVCCECVGKCSQNFPLCISHSTTAFIMIVIIYPSPSLIYLKFMMAWIECVTRCALHVECLLIQHWYGVQYLKEIINLDAHNRAFYIIICWKNFSFARKLQELRAFFGKQNVFGLLYFKAMHLNLSSFGYSLYQWCSEQGSRCQIFGTVLLRLVNFLGTGFPLHTHFW